MRTDTSVEGDQAGENGQEDREVETWAELKWTTEGVGLTTYEQRDGKEVETLDETWWTWSEFTGIDTTDHPISRSGKTHLDATPTTDTASIHSKLDELAEDHYQTEPANPTLIFAGDPPMYDDRLPDDWDVCTELDEINGVRIVRYKPRAWNRNEDGVFTLRDGTLDNGKSDDVEFEIEIEPDDYISYRIPNPLA